MGDDDGGVFENLVGVGKDGIELDGLAGAERVLLVGEADVDAPRAHPADLVVIAVGFGVVERTAGLGFAVEEFDALVGELFEVEGPGPIALDGFPVGGSRFDQGEKIGGGEAEDLGEAIERLEFDQILVSLELGEAGDRQGRCRME